MEERDRLGLRGVLPPAVCTPAEQEARAYGNYLRAGEDVKKYLFLAGLQDRNETLFYHLLLSHLEEMVPIVYTPTVGKVCEEYSHIYRRPRGLFVSARDRGRIAEVMTSVVGLDPRIIVVTDNEAILGIGDQGVGGMGIPIGKLALYVAGAGLHPAQTLPLDLDVGTMNPKLREDPLYLGLREPRLRGEPYFALLDELVDAISKAFPRAIVQWEDFSSETAFEVLARYRRRLPTFNDDIQGTGAVIVAGVRTALRRVSRRLEDERVVFFGAGASGSGTAIALRGALRDAGMAETEITRRVVCLDSRGLILADRPGLSGHKRMVAADPALVSDWDVSGGEIRLLDVVRNFHPTILVGASGQPSAFTEEIVRTMHQHCPRPIILPISNPTSKAEAVPADILRWTNGAAVVGTGSPFAPVAIGGVTHQIGQGNNALIFPGVGLGASVVGARWMPDSVFTAAAAALFELSTADESPGAPIYPPVSHLREVSRAVAAAVGRALVAAEAAPQMSPTEIDERIARSIWEPTYRPYRAAEVPVPVSA
jgi:malic enzyme